MIKKFLYYSFIFICFFIASTLNVDAEEVSYSTRYYYYDTYNSTSDNYGLVSGANNYYALDPTQFLYGAVNVVNYSITNGTNYTIRLYLSFNNVAPNEFRTDTFSRFYSKTYAKSTSDFTFNNITANYSVEPDNLTSTYNIVINYDVTAKRSSSYFEIGFSDSSANYDYFGLYTHNYVSVVSVNKIIVEKGDNSIEINQNNTIINQNQTIIDNSNKTNEELNDINDNITNDNVSGVEESFSQFEDFLDDNSTITQLITLPVTLYSSILNGVSNSCTPFNLGNLYGQNLTLPCVNIGNYLGSTLWGMIDLIISGFAIYSISKKLIKVFNNFSSMKDGDVIDD